MTSGHWTAMLLIEILAACRCTAAARVHAVMAKYQFMKLWEFAKIVQRFISEKVPTASRFLRKYLSGFFVRNLQKFNVVQIV